MAKNIFFRASFDTYSLQLQKKKFNFAEKSTTIKNIYIQTN